MNMPNNCDPVEWAKYNQCSQPSGAVAGSTCAPQAGTRRAKRFLDSLAAALPRRVRIEELGDELPGPVQDLTLAVRRAASELEGQGEKSDRIATQLLTALARFHAETGL